MVQNLGTPVRPPSSETVQKNYGYISILRLRLGSPSVLQNPVPRSPVEQCLRVSKSDSKVSPARIDGDISTALSSVKEDL